MHDIELQKSYEWCERLTKERAKNFYHGLRLLPEERRLGACAFYAFCRDCDDISDDEGSDNRQQRMDEWNKRISADISECDWPGLLAFRHAIDKFSIPHRFLYELIEGPSMDLTERKYVTYQDTYKYCYHVASTVGLVCVHIFGFNEANQSEVYRMAEMQGIAFQLTNIMRDVSEDCGMQRCYLPSEMLERFGVSAEDISAQRDTPQMRALYEHMSELIEGYYFHCASLPQYIEPESRACLRAMTLIYHGIARKIAKMGPQALRQRARLSKLEKVLCVGQAYILGNLELFWHNLLKHLKGQN